MSILSKPKPHVSETNNNSHNTYNAPVFNIGQLIVTDEHLASQLLASAADTANEPKPSPPHLYDKHDPFNPS